MCIGRRSVALHIVITWRCRQHCVLQRPFSTWLVFVCSQKLTLSRQSLGHSSVRPNGRPRRRNRNRNRTDTACRIRPARLAQRADHLVGAVHRLTCAMNTRPGIRLRPARRPRVRQRRRRQHDRQRLIPFHRRTHTHGGLRAAIFLSDQPVKTLCAQPTFIANCSADPRKVSRRCRRPSTCRGSYSSPTSPHRTIAFADTSSCHRIRRLDEPVQRHAPRSISC
jgi:hypothetical protein